MIGRLKFESIGAYIPGNELSTAEVVKGCRNVKSIPLEFLTGILRRPVAEESEYGLDLAVKATRDCFQKSQLSPSDIDLVVSCSISRHRGPNVIAIEPAFALQLATTFGLTNAYSFDLSNACAGFFTALTVVEWLLKAGVVRNCLIVSGERISDLLRTSQIEIVNLADSRLAGLTLGDSGVAAIVTLTKDPRIGVIGNEIYTLGAYHHLCVAKVSTFGHGRLVMHTESSALQSLAIEQCVAHTQYFLSRYNWTSSMIDAVIPHQTSMRPIAIARSLLNAVMSHDGTFTQEQFVCTVGHRGNLASNAHMIALMDSIDAGLIGDGSNVVFSIAASGYVGGTMLYSFDDFPSRHLQRKLSASPTNFESPLVDRCEDAPDAVCILGAATSKPVNTLQTMIELALNAAEECILTTKKDRNDIDLLIYTGVYRDELLSEPSIACILAGELGINVQIAMSASAKILCFDLLNGAVGPIDACRLATSAIITGKKRLALIVSAESACNAPISDVSTLRIAHGGSAMLIGASSDESTGFGSFAFKSFSKFSACSSAYYEVVNDVGALIRREDSIAENRYAQCAADSVADFLDTQRMSLEDISFILPPQRGDVFRRLLSKHLNIKPEVLIHCPTLEGDHFTSSFVRSYLAATATRQIKRGDLALILGLGSGVQTACALYRF